MMQSPTNKDAKDFARILAEWPVSIPKKGIIITSFGESIPFVEYMLCGNLLLLDRGMPDSAGARRVIMTVDCVEAIKITEPVEMARFTAMGFQGRQDRRVAPRS